MAFSSLNGSSPVKAGTNHISESVFRGLCLQLGTSQIVAIRRETRDLKDIFYGRLSTSDGFTRMLTGSSREGFRMKGSDMDVMWWLNDHKIIWKMSQSEFYNTANQTMILADISECPPGFSLLQLLTPTTNLRVSLAIVRKNDIPYISSSMYRKCTLSEVIHPGISTAHGPCSSGIQGRVEFDHASCFVSNFWPQSASSWIERCHSWPNSEIVNDIVKTGCHFVAISHPLGTHENEEWRISFSQAECKLVYAMNHCQFLTYGLLKLFLKEVINLHSEETVNLLCSYHMKTVVFWAIQQNTLPHWCPQNLLEGFWVCLKLLLNWVYQGICPNFFISQNNMFLAKVYGSKQRSLFEQLYEYYRKGLSCLLQSSSVRSFILGALCNPKLHIYTHQIFMISEIHNDIELFNEMGTLLSIRTGFSVKQNSIILMKTAEYLINSPMTPCQKVMLQIVTATNLRNIAFILQNNCVWTNKQLHIADKISRSMLKLAGRIGCISDTLFIAMYHFKTLRYMEALSAVEMTKIKLAEPQLLYRRIVHVRRYTDALGGKSWSTKMKRAVALEIALDNFICYINELMPERQSALQNRNFVLIIPVFVMLHFLEFLCYRHIDTALAQAALDKLHALVQYDQGLYIDELLRDISWEILGICHQITGNFEAALFSYQQALTHFSVNNIRIATQTRIHDVVRTNTSGQNI